MTELRSDAAASHNWPVTATCSIIALAASAFHVIPAHATPPSGFARTEVSTGSFAPFDVKADKIEKWDLFLKTKDETTIGVDRLAVAVDGQSGWHTHAGATLVTVTVGEIVWIDGVVCSRKTYRVGDTFVEPANHVHLVRNTSGAPAEFVAVQIRPEAAAGRIDAPAPENCTF